MIQQYIALTSTALEFSVPLCHKQKGMNIQTWPHRSCIRKKDEWNYCKQTTIFLCNFICFWFSFSWCRNSGKMECQRPLTQNVNYFLWCLRFQQFTLLLVYLTPLKTTRVQRQSSLARWLYIFLLILCCWHCG